MKTELERILISSYKDEMISWLKSHPEHLDEAIRLALSNKQPFAWRAAYLLWDCMENNDPRVKPFIQDFLNAIPGKEDGHQREIIKILGKMELNEDQEGILFDICVSLWEKIGKIPSIRYSAFRVIINIAKKYPGLSDEIKILASDQYLETLSPGARRGVIRMAKELG